MNNKKEIAAIKDAKKDYPDLAEAIGLLLRIVETSYETQKEFKGRDIEKPDYKKLDEGFPLADKRILDPYIEILWERFTALVRVILESDSEAASKMISFFEDKKLFKMFIVDVLIGEYKFPDNYSLSKPVALYAANETLFFIFDMLSEVASDIWDLKKWKSSYCPICGALPNLSFIQGDENRLFLLCSRCFTRWQNRRIKCQFCGEEDSKNLRYFETENDKVHRVYVCDTCKHYLKCTDQRKKPVIYPRLEDLITLKLDFLAKRDGYIRETIDLVGMLLLEESKK